MLLDFEEDEQLFEKYDVSRKTWNNSRKALDMQTIEKELVNTILKLNEMVLIDLFQRTGECSFHYWDEISSRFLFTPFCVSYVKIMLPLVGTKYMTPVSCYKVWSRYRFFVSPNELILHIFRVSQESIELPKIYLYNNYSL